MLIRCTEDVGKLQGNHSIEEFYASGSRSGDLLKKVECKVDLDPVSQHQISFYRIVRYSWRASILQKKPRLATRPSS